MPNTIRWGLLSTSGINNALIDPIRQATRSELVAVASRDGARAQAYATAKGIAKAHGSYEALLADPEIDAVYIALPNALHCEWTVKAAQAGKHVLIEKPAAVTLDELAQMEEAATAAGVTVFEAFMYLHHPQTRTAIDMTRSGRLGHVQTVVSWFHFYLQPEDRDNIRLSAGLTGGALWDVGVYPNSMVIALIGDGAPAEVWAQQIIGETGVDVAMRAQMRFTAGAVAQVSCGFRTPFREGTHVIGDEGMLVIPEPWKPGTQGADSVMTFTPVGGAPEQIVTPAVNPYLCEVEAMEACILDGAAPVVPLSLSRQFLQGALAQYQSAATGQVVVVA